MQGNGGRKVVDLTPRRIGLLVHEGALLLNVAGLSEALAAANRHLAARIPGATISAYDVEILSTSGGLVACSAGVRIETRALADVDDECFDTIVVAGGGGARSIANDYRVLDWLRRTAERVRRIAAFDGGTLVLARAGLLDQRRCVGHWHYAGNFAEEFPRIMLDCEALFVRDGNRLTAAGFSSSMDMALAILEEDHGQPLSLDIARLLVVPRIRGGDQPQLSMELCAQYTAAPRIARAAEWIIANIQKNPRVTSVADHFAMSERTFSRNFSRQMGLSPQRFMEQVRLETAQRWLSSSDLPIDRVAHRAGYSGPEHLAQTFRKSLGMSPSGYRKQSRERAKRDATR